MFQVFGSEVAPPPFLPQSDAKTASDLANWGYIVQGPFHSIAKMLHQHSDNCSHGLDLQTKRRQLIGALVLIGGFAAIEWGAGQWSHSLALIAEAGHMISDCLALGLALAATFMVKPVQRDGWLGKNQLQLAPDRRPEIWAAFVNGVGLVVLGAWIGWEAWEAWQQPSLEIATQPMLLTAIAGVAVNGINVALLHRGSEDDLNLKGAMLHVIADMASAIGVIIAAVIVAVFHWIQADCVVSFGIAALIIVSAIPLVIESSRQLRSNLNHQQPR
jgi:cobalt-zinc-cadmium efflux system protein